MARVTRRPRSSESLSSASTRSHAPRRRSAPSAAPAPRSMPVSTMSWRSTKSLTKHVRAAAHRRAARSSACGARRRRESRSGTLQPPLPRLGRAPSAARMAATRLGGIEQMEQRRPHRAGARSQSSIDQCPAGRPDAAPWPPRARPPDSAPGMGTRLAQIAARWVLPAPFRADQTQPGSRPARPGSRSKPIGLPRSRGRSRKSSTP